MKKCSALVLLACAFALLTAERVAAAPVTWDFIATSCSAAVAFTPVGGGCDPAQQYPLVVATLTLDGPDSSGNAGVQGLGGPPAPPSPSGAPFAFDLVAAQTFGGNGHSAVSTANPTGTYITASGPWVVGYNISHLWGHEREFCCRCWSE